mmetsp:Transcript_10996/g.17351  ORF Transcript_10996/g.17351 Transcript_10996/m.17351 type:complete len:155 (-) Transcript_10996:366-830(-)
MMIKSSRSMMMKVSIMRHHHHHNNNNHADQLKNITIKNNKIKEMMIPPPAPHKFVERKKKAAVDQQHTSSSAVYHHNNDIPLSTKIFLILLHDLYLIFNVIDQHLWSTLLCRDQLAPRRRLFLHHRAPRGLEGARQRAQLQPLRGPRGQPVLNI